MSGFAEQSASPVPSLAEALRRPVDAIGARFSLASREREVLLLTASGMHTKAVASALGCSTKTVEEYWKRIFQKVSQHSRQLIIAMVVAEALSPTPS